MKYSNYTDPVSGDQYINGHYVGIREGTPTPDALDADRTGYEVHEETARMGTITPDTLESVNVLELVSIAITTPATKTNYNVGDTLDLTGLVVTGSYSGGSTKILTVSDSDVAGFDSSAAIASQTLTITIDGKTATYNIVVTE